MAKKRKQVLLAKSADRQRLETFFDTIAPDLVRRLTVAEAKAAHLEEDLAFLRGKLTGLLNKDQLDAARVCGCRPEVYAIECINLWKEKIFPGFPSYVHNLAELKQYKPATAGDPC